MLKVSGFGFNLPASAKVLHLQLDVERSSASGLLVDHLVEIDTDQSGTQNLAKPNVRWSSQGEVMSYGGPGSHLGSNFPASSINAATFTVRLAARNDEATGTDLARIDRVSVTVTYTDATLSGPYTASQIASIEDPAKPNDTPWSPLTASTLAVADGDFVETGDFVANGLSEFLTATGFGVALPAGAVPSGVLVEVTRQCTVLDWAIHTWEARLVKGGAMDAATYATESTSEWVKAPAWQTSTFGNASDLWNGGALTRADVADPGFGVAIRLYAGVGSTIAGMHGRYDQLRLWVAHDPVERTATSTPTVAEQTRVGAVWNNPGNVTAGDGAEALSQLWGELVSDFLRVRDFGFNVPAQAWVQGISFDMTRRALTGGYIADRIVRLAGVPEATGNRALDPATRWVRTVSTQRYGGPADRWGTRPIEPAQVNASAFGLDLSTGYRYAGGNDVGYVDLVTATVTYCEP
ncbi:MAG: hypothetical protein QM765_51340 [Myxococcales bacterium]